MRFLTVRTLLICLIIGSLGLRGSFAELPMTWASRFEGFESSELPTVSEVAYDGLPNDPVEMFESLSTTPRVELGQDESSGSESQVIIPGVFSSVEFLSWTVHRRGLDYAIPTDDTAGSVGFGEVQNVVFGPSSGFRTALGYGLRNGSQLLFRYTSFVSDATASAVDTSGNLWATRAHPNQGEEALTADAFSSMDYDVFDFEMKQWFMVRQTSRLAVIGGFRWANILQDFGVDYDGSDFDMAVYRNRVDMTGFGLRLGVEGERRLLGGISAFGRAAGAIMKGNFVSRLVETNFSGTDSVVDVTDEYTSPLMQFEVAAGLHWRRGPFALAVGYEMSNWLNLGERSSFSSATHEGAYDPESVDVLVEGLFARGVVVF